MERDFEADPYDRTEARVAQWISEKINVGGGDDPVAFLMAAQAASHSEAERYSQMVAALNDALVYYANEKNPHDGGERARAAIARAEQEWGEIAP